MPKILELVDSCAKCPNKVYSSGGVYQCRLVEVNLEDGNKIADFCPLTDFPAEKIAGLNRTIKMLTGPYNFTLSLAVMSHVSAKLGCMFDSTGSAISLYGEDGKVVTYLRFDNITNIEIRLGSVIQFIGDDGEKFTLYPDAKPPVLRRELEEKTPDRKPLFQEIRLKVG